MRWTEVCSRMRGCAAALLLVAAAPFMSPASAATVTMIDFSGDKNAAPYLQGGFAFETARILNGNCVSNACLSLNDNESTTMAYTGVPASFTLSGLSFNLLGKGKGKGTGNALTITGSNGTSLTYSTADFAHNSYYTLAFNDAFANVTSVLFTTGNGGNVRIDDLIASPTPAPIPLPAAAWLLLGGVGALVAVRRRRDITA